MHFKISTFAMGAVLALTVSCASKPQKGARDAGSADSSATMPKKGYAPVNGLQMYYEIHGEGEPLVLLHGGGSTIDVTYAKAIPVLAQTRMVIAFEEQAHGRTVDIDREVTFENTADDVAAALKYLKIQKADIMGFSNGGNTAMQIAIRHPSLVRKLIVSSAFFRRDGLYPSFWPMMKKASIADMPQPLKDAYLKVSPQPEKLQAMHDRDAKRMNSFKDWSAATLRSIQAPTLVMSGDQDIVKPEHSVQMMRLLPKGRLVIFPGGHDAFLGDVISVKPGSRMTQASLIIIEEFLAN